ncbi:ABC transporter ATP-binding protein [Pelagibius sp. CAU 1746]|uniref:ABC transporter ATP-binding protein n=1 Tax=Pelagibius sp. CAU 1746 TaxID=3140370 RepID=UPI00325ABB0E
MKARDGDLLTARDVVVSFSGGGSLADVLRRRPAREVRAVDGVGLRLAAGETLGIVGESGCGKTTLGRTLLGLTPRKAGEILFKGRDLDDLLARSPPEFRRRAQMIFQDPTASLNPKMTVFDTLAEVLKVHRLAPEGRLEDAVAALLNTVGMPADLMYRRPRALSGGQCQRVGIARALALKPDLIVADESVSALDVSVQAQILNLLMELQHSHHMALIFISHDLTVVQHLCQRVAVMYLGRIVEEGPAEEIFAQPKHPYTQALLAAKPKLGGASLAELELLQGEPPSPLSVPPGCAFHPRCPHVMAACREAPSPALRTLRAQPSGAVSVACHLYGAASDQEMPSELAAARLKAGTSEH